MTFANPWGLLGLLAIPAILLIHFFRRESRQVIVSTLFLIPEVEEVTRSGRRFQRLQQSIPLWLQLLIALILTWLLVQPRWLVNDSQQHYVFVLDSSLSMDAFKEELSKALDVQIKKMASTAKHIEWTLMTSDTTQGTHYRGRERADFLRAVDAWMPTRNAHDFAPALRSAQALAGNAGVVIFVTDRQPAHLPFGINMLSIGEPLENWGFTGVQVEGQDGQHVWRTLIQNYGQQSATRTWWMEVDGQKSEAREVRLASGQSLAIQGAFPEGKDRVELILEGDRFTVDDRVPIIRPHAKQVFFATQIEERSKAVVSKLLSSIKDAQVITTFEKSDIYVTSKLIEQSSLPQIVFSASSESEGKSKQGIIVKENHPLLTDLTFNGLLVRAWSSAPFTVGQDTALLWKGDHPLIFLKKRGAFDDLVFNFSLADSNADRLPGFVLLVHRFVETIRDKKQAVETRNFESMEMLEALRGLSKDDITFEGKGTSHTWRAPVRPRFFKASVNGALVVDAASHFADVQEADFKSASRFDTLSDIEASLVEAHYESDVLGPLWIMLIISLLMGCWYYTGRPEA